MAYFLQPNLAIWCFSGHLHDYSCDWLILYVHMYTIANNQKIKRSNKVIPYRTYSLYTLKNMHNGGASNAYIVFVS